MEASAIQNDLKKIFFAEFLGTVLFIGGILFSAASATTPLMVACGVSASLITSITIFGRYSGAHFNPVVTLAYYLFIQKEGTKYRKTCAVMILAQYLGGICSGMLFRVVYGYKHPTMIPNEENLWASFVNETFFSFMFLTIVFCVKSEIHNFTHDAFLGGLAVSIALVGVILYGGPMSGACYNPASGLSIILWSSIAYQDMRYWNYFPFYLAATNIGSFFAGALCKHWIEVEDSKKILVKNEGLNVL